MGISYSYIFAIGVVWIIGVYAGMRISKVKILSIKSRQYGNTIKKDSNDDIIANARKNITIHLVFEDESYATTDTLADMILNFRDIKEGFRGEKEKSRDEKKWFKTDINKLSRINLVEYDLC